MALYTYDDEADALYVLLVEERQVGVERTVELGPRLYVDIDSQGRMVGVEILYPRTYGIDLGPVEERYGIQIEIPFRFTA